jgi:hypothetical protein
MRVELTREQSAQAAALFATGARRYREEPVIVGQIRRNVLPDEPGGFHLAAIVVSQSVARKIKKLLETERLKLSKP